MLGKLIKYEFKATARVFLPLLGALIVISAINRLFMSLDLNTPKVIGTVISVILMVGICVLAFILTLQRFRQNILSNEGYLTLTLPVRTDWIILSKLFVSSVWYIASFIVVMVAILIMAVTDFDFSDLAAFFRELGQMLPIERVQALVYVIEAVVGTIISLFSATLMLYACMALSMLVNKRRGLFTFVAFIVIITALQILAVIGVNIGDALNIGGMFDGWTPYAASQAGILFMLIIDAAVAAVFYFTTRYMLKRKLNLQ